MKRYIKARISDALDQPLEAQEEIARTSNNPEDLAALVNAYPTDYMLCYYVAQNPSADISTLSFLMNHSARYVREAVASNPNTTVDMLWKLSDDEESQVLFGILRNPNVTEDLIKKLANAEDVNVKLAALERLGFIISEFDDGSIRVNGEPWDLFRRYI